MRVWNLSCEGMNMHTVTYARHPRTPQCDVAGENGTRAVKSELFTQLRKLATFVLPKVASQESMESEP